MRQIYPDDLILVAIVKTPKDLEILRVLGWYRIPLGSAPKMVRVDWLAFYQPGAFGADRWMVRYAAPVRGMELTRRRELLWDQPDHPRVDEPYYRIQLGPLQELPRPIPSRSWRRFTFLYTNGARLLAAQDLRDLRIPLSGERQRLWRALRERAQAPA
jgi:hypothetical protein